MDQFEDSCPCCTPRTGTSQKRRALLSAIGAATAGVMLSSAGVRSAHAQSLKTLPVGGLVGAASHNVGIETARAKDFASANGLRLDPKEYNAGAFLLQAIASGEVVAGVCGSNPTVLARAQGLDVKMIAASNLEGTVLVVGPDIKSPKDLNGKKIGSPGVAAIQDTLLLLYEQKNGIKTDHVYMKVTDMPTMLRNKEIAGYIVWEITGQAGLKVGGGRVMASSHDILPGHECCSLVASGKFLRDDPDGAQRLVRTFAQGLKHAIANRNELVELIARRDGTDVETAKVALGNVQFKYPPFNDPKDVTFVVESLLKSERLDRKQVPDTAKFVADLVDNRLIRSVA